MKNIIYLFIVLVMSISTQAQSFIPGEYYLRGVTEVVSGFLFKPDSTFQFFFSYGALDRKGSGKWELKEKEIILNSKPRPAHDFAMINHGKKEDDFISIRIIDDNSLLVRYVFVRATFTDTVMEAMTDEKGIARFPKKEMKSLSLIFQFCPEKVSLFHTGKDDNYFEFRFEPCGIL